MQEELLAARKAGNDVDRLVMKELLARVRDSGPNTAFKALASIEVCVCVVVLCLYTRRGLRRPSHMCIVIWKGSGLFVCRFYSCLICVFGDRTDQVGFGVPRVRLLP